MDQDRKSAPDNQGEGNREVARHYNDAQKKFVDSGKVEPAAKDAGEALDGPEAQALKDAGREGASQAKK